MRNANTKQERDTSLDFLKVMAAFAVLKLHSGYYGTAGAILQYMCGFAIPVFFMVSGALLLNRADGVSAAYVKKRMIRILALMFAWNLMIVILVSLKNKSIVNPLEYFIQAMFQKGCFWHFWYLWSLVFLTAVSPFLYKVFASEKKCKAFILTLLIICFILSMATVYDHGKYIAEIHIPQAFRLWSHLLYFCLGGVIYRYGRKEAIRNLYRKHIVSVMIILVLLSISVAFVQFGICYGTPFSSPEYCFSNLVIIFYNAVLFFSVISIKGGGRTPSRILQALNADSLGIYILHPFLMLVFNRIRVWNFSYPIFNFLLLAFTSVLLAECMRRMPGFNRLIKL